MVLSLIHLILFNILLFIVGYIIYCLLLNKNMGNNSLIFSYPLGAGIYSLILFILNKFLGVKFFILVLDSTLFLLIFILLGFLKILGGKLKIKGDIKNFISLIQNIKIKNNFFGLIVILLFFITVITLINNLLLPIDAWDAFLYHFPLAESIFTNHSLPHDVSPSYTQIQATYPALVFIIYGISNIILNEFSYFIPKILPTFFALLTFIILYKIVREKLKKDIKTALLALLLALSSYTVSYRILNENIDFVFTFFALGAIYFYNPKKYNSIGNLIMCGILLGLSYWAKNLGIILVFCFGIYFLYNLLIKKIRIFYEGVLVLSSSMIIILPHFFYNLIKWGDPLYPSLAKYLGGYRINEWVINNILSFYHPSMNLSIPFLKLFSEFMILFFFILYLFDKKEKNDYAQFMTIIGISYFIIWIFALGSTNGEIIRLLFPSLFLFCALGSSKFIYFFNGWDNKKFYEIILFLGMVILILIRIKNIEWNILSLYINIGIILPISFFIIFVINYFFKIKVKTWKFLIIGCLLISFFTLLIGGLYDSVIIKKDFGSDISPKYIEPEGEWMFEHIKEGCLLTFDGRKHIIPVCSFPADSVILQPIYEEGISLDEAVKILKSNNIRYIHKKLIFQTHPLFLKSIIYNNLYNGNYFMLEYNEEGNEVFRVK